MDKILRIGTFLAFTSGLLLLGKGIVNPLDIFMILLALFSIIKNPTASILFLKKNREYYVIASAFLFSISLSFFGAQDKIEVLKNLFQISAYILLIPLTFTINRDITEDAKLAFILISVVFFLYSFPLFCTQKPVRLSIFGIHPNALGFIFSLFALLSLKNLPVFLFFSFLSSLTFSRASLLALSLSLLSLSILERKPRVIPLAFLPILLTAFMPSLIQIYKNSNVCKNTKGFLPSPSPTDIRLVRIYDFDRVRLIEASLKMFFKNPITGVGLGNFNLAARNMCKNGELDKAQCSASLPQRDAHNFIFGFLSETGIVGLLFFLIFWGFLFKLLISSGDSLGTSVFILSTFMSLLHPPIFFTRFMGPLVWYIILKDKLKISSYEGSGKV